MTEKKQPAAKPKVRRRVSKPRLLREILTLMNDTNMGDGDPISALLKNIEQGIVDEAVANS